MKIARSIQTIDVLCQGDISAALSGSSVSWLSSKQLLERDEAVEAVRGALQISKQEHYLGQMHDGR